jgi:hypothetical protein
MRVSSRSSSSFSPIFIVVGTCALLVLIVVLITGGFVIDAGPLHFSARRWRGPLVVALIAWTSAALRRSWPRPSSFATSRTAYLPTGLTCAFSSLRFQRRSS